jgi:hypothetical protein
MIQSWMNSLNTVSNKKKMKETRGLLSSVTAKTDNRKKKY